MVEVAKVTHFFNAIFFYSLAIKNNRNINISTFCKNKTYFTRKVAHYSKRSFIQDDSHST